MSSADLLGTGGVTAAAGGPGGGSGDTRFWTKYYYYSSNGDVFEDEGTIEGIVTNFEGSNVYTANRLGYGANGRTVTHVLGERWGGGEPYEITFAREFRSDGARQRYLNRELDPADLDNVLSETWSDYDGDDIYGDFEMVGSTQSELRSYEPGIGEVDPWLGGGMSFTTYYHTNALGSTMGLSDPGGAGSFDFVYTAFGEQRMGPAQRYGFAGAHGYQSHDEFPFMHLGHRFYNPETGRFLQRDPIGIKGGTNVYAYVLNRPTSGVDPTGEGMWSILGGTVGVIVGGLLIVVTTPVWVTAVGVGIVVVSAVVVVREIIDIWPSAERVVKPIRNGVKRRHREVDNAIDCTVLGMKEE